MFFSINYFVEKNLCNIELNKKFKIEKILDSSFPIKRRLLELGFISGREIKVVGKSLTKQTILIEIEGYLLSLKCGVANMVIVR